MVMLDLKGLPAGERRPKIQEAIARMEPGDTAMLVISHEDFWGAIPKTIEGFSGQVDFQLMTFEKNYSVVNILVQKR